MAADLAATRSPQRKDPNNPSRLTWPHLGTDRLHCIRPAFPFICLRTRIYERYPPIPPTMEISLKVYSTSLISTIPTHVETYRDDTSLTIRLVKRISQLQTTPSSRSRHGSLPTVLCRTSLLRELIPREHSFSIRRMIAPTNLLLQTIQCGDSMMEAFGNHKTSTLYMPCQDRREP